MEKGGFKSKVQSADQSEVRMPWKPKSQNVKKEPMECPYCHGVVNPDYSICPHCGRSLTPDKCSFCGAAMKPAAKFCTHCGQSREGVVCPRCGTLNSRNFCRKCNFALTPMGLQAMEEAAGDPAFMAILAKAEELAELHRRIEELEAEPDGSGLSDADRAMLDEYADLLGSIGKYDYPGEKKSVDSPRNGNKRTELERPSEWHRKEFSLEEIMKAYREKADEMNAALAALAPPPDSSPEQQRDYFSARKVAKVVTKVDLSLYEPSVWICNFCGCEHLQPSDCMRPQLGGHWVFRTEEDYVKAHPEAGTISLEFD